ncbi:MAG TPA: hypothetical protein VGQ52_17765 [Gemmatimonadaceae bacterium]|nr:hypothetical protein [Gemmatimonadaceae bacterium]
MPNNEAGGFSTDPIQAFVHLSLTAAGMTKRPAAVVTHTVIYFGQVMQLEPELVVQ